MELTPKFPQRHPGQLIVRQCLEPSEMSITEAAEKLGVTRALLSRIINGHAGISAEMALRLAEVFGSSAEFWMRVQSAYDLQQARSARESQANSPPRCTQGHLRETEDRGKVRAAQPEVPSNENSLGREVLSPFLAHRERRFSSALRAFAAAIGLGDCAVSSGQLPFRRTSLTDSPKGCVFQLTSGSVIIWAHTKRDGNGEMIADLPPEVFEGSHQELVMDTCGAPDQIVPNASLNATCHDVVDHTPGTKGNVRETRGRIVRHVAGREHINVSFPCKVPPETLLARVV